MGSLQEQAEVERLVVQRSVETIGEIRMGITDHGFVIGIDGTVAVLVDKNHVAGLRVWQGLVRCSFFIRLENACCLISVEVSHGHADFRVSHQIANAEDRAGADGLATLTQIGHFVANEGDVTSHFVFHQTLLVAVVDHELKTGVLR